MIAYEYVTLQGTPMVGECAHIKVRYTAEEISVLLFDADGDFDSRVNIVGYLTPPEHERQMTNKFVCSRFTIDGALL